MAITFWQKVRIDIQSALAAAITINAITKANPGVVTYTGTDPVNGDYALVTAQGMRELNYRVVRVANVNGVGNTFELDGLDTTTFGTFTSGTFQLITFGTSINTITEVSSSGGEAEFEDTTLVHDDIRTQAPTVFSALLTSMTSIWDPADPGLIALKAASDTKTERAIRITYANGKIFSQFGFIGATLAPGGNAPGKVTTPIVITGQGPSSVWAS